MNRIRNYELAGRPINTSPIDHRQDISPGHPDLPMRLTRRGKVALGMALAIATTGIGYSVVHDGRQIKSGEIGSTGEYNPGISGLTVHSEANIRSSAGIRGPEGGSNALATIKLPVDEYGDIIPVELAVDGAREFTDNNGRWLGITTEEAAILVNPANLPSFEKDADGIVYINAPAAGIEVSESPAED